MYMDRSPEDRSNQSEKDDGKSDKERGYRGFSTLTRSDFDEWERSLDFHQWSLEGTREEGKSWIKNDKRNC
ncbi:Hypothetical protein NTJ_11349 [Nesidiocoris tenuis]|uniref:Uncharacterized protein n=1 Tax=Nesidiocoris tenuis TaxID=355587 RepID=A0ABN7B4L4_9HEMI|nr:Hypothetical protein NTJ_11349 [Nesidiocoris tenuis]